MRLFRCIAVILAILISGLVPTGLALADNVVNDVTAGGNDTFTAGGSTTVDYWIVANSGDGQAGCNASDGTAATVTINAPASVTATPSSRTFTACGDGAAQSVTFSSNTPGDYDITVSVSDAGTGTYNTNPGKFTLHVLAPLTPTNNVPEINVAAPSVTVDEGQIATITGVYSDADTGDNVHISASPPIGTITKTGTNSGTWTWSFQTTDGTSETQAVTITADDGNDGTASVQFDLVVNNVAPTITGISPSAGALYKAGDTVTVTGSFTDPAGAADNPYAVLFDWDDSTSTLQSVTYGAAQGGFSATKIFSGAGVYTIRVTVTDKDGGFSSTSVMVVVYDPSAGFVTGGGWISSPAGAYRPDQTLSGKATFGFVSKYQRGATTPIGQTEFQFHAAGMNFHSSSYQWLVVAGAKAQYKGTGTMNGVSGYGFLLTATDGQASGGGGADKFRIKIWNISSGEVVYDNAYESSEDIDSANPQTIGGGSIVIHAK
ncbi:MAG: hypothetical protein HYX84_07215 [Chloroflexi bacterium]|nr:hypothetical protein [Chloroflexota bacterium]